jgi:hypothetical protein
MRIYLWSALCFKNHGFENEGFEKEGFNCGFTLPFLVWPEATSQSSICSWKSCHFINPFNKKLCSFFPAMVSPDLQFGKQDSVEACSTNIMVQHLLTSLR